MIWSVEVTKVTVKPRSRMHMRNEQTHSGLLNQIASYQEMVSTEAYKKPKAFCIHCAENYYFRISQKDKLYDLPRSQQGILKEIKNSDWQCPTCDHAVFWSNQFSLHTADSKDQEFARLESDVYVGKPLTARIRQAEAFLKSRRKHRNVDQDLQWFKCGLKGKALTKKEYYRRIMIYLFSKGYITKNQMNTALATLDDKQLKNSRDSREKVQF